MGALACASVNNSWNVGDFKDITPLSYLHSNFKHIRGKEIPSAGRVFSVFLSHYRMSPHMVTSMEIYDLEMEIVQWIFISHQWPSWPSLTDGTVCVFWKYLVHQYCLSPESSLSFKMSAAYVRVKNCLMKCKTSERFDTFLYTYHKPDQRRTDLWHAGIKLKLCLFSFLTNPKMEIASGHQHPYLSVCAGNYPVSTTIPPFLVIGTVQYFSPYKTEIINYSKNIYPLHECENMEIQASLSPNV